MSTEIEGALRDFIKYVDQTIQGSGVDFKELNDQSPESCAGECMKLKHCKSFDFLVTDVAVGGSSVPQNRCYLKNDKATHDKMKPLKGVDHYRRVDGEYISTTPNDFYHARSISLLDTFSLFS